jgi:porin
MLSRTPPCSALPVACVVSACLCASLAHAQPASGSQTLENSAPPSGQQSPIPGPGNSTAPAGTGPSPGQPGFITGLFSSSRSNLLGDLYGVRTILGNYGISLGLQETSEVFGNATGGIRRGAEYNGLTLMSLGLDTGKAFGWEGGIFNVSAFQIHGRNVSAENLLTLQTASGIEANRATRLWELWYQQSFLGDKLDVKVGQQSVDQEFIVSQGSGLFINTAMGWPLIPSVDLYAGGPAYPLSSLGVRVRAQPVANLTVLAGVFDDNPPGGPFLNDSQVRGAEQSGAKFNTGTGALFLSEAQYAINSPAPGQKDGTAHSGLPGVYKLGFWYDTGRFFDQRYDVQRVSLADPSSSGTPRVRRHNFSVYGVFDQMIWRPDPDGPRSLGIFARLMGAPGDRNLADFSANAGIALKAPLPGRDNDSIGVGFGVAKISPSAIGLDQDTDRLSRPYPIRSSETFIEVTYQYQAAPWWLVQPDFQYVFTPGGGIPDPLRPGQRVGNEALFGLRTNIVF